MVRLDKHYGASWVEAFTAAFRAGDHEQTSAMLSEMSHWGRENIVDYRDASEGLEDIVDGLHRLGVALPAGVAAWDVPNFRRARCRGRRFTTVISVPDLSTSLSALSPLTLSRGTLRAPSAPIVTWQ